METTTLTAMIFAAVLTGVVGHWFYLKQKDKAKLDALSDLVSEHKEKLKNLEARVEAAFLANSTSLRSLEESMLRRLDELQRLSITEIKTKEMISEETRELKSDIKSLTELISSLRIDLGILNWKNKDNKE